mgnify:CR=1 FL=1
MPKHGVFVTEEAISAGTPVAVETGIPFVIGLSPLNQAENPAAVGIPVLCTSYAEFVDQFGYSDDWSTYNLCEFAYSHFKLFDMQPAIFVNLLDPSTMNTAVAAADISLTNHKLILDDEAIDDDNLVVKTQGGGGSAYVKGTDYTVYVDADGHVTVEVLSGGACYSATKLNVAYKKVTPSSVTAASVATGLESIDLCMTGLGVVPDLICAPGFSENASVSAVMAAKADSINGMFRGMALVDISTTSADSYDDVTTVKANASVTSDMEIACWPMAKLDDKVFHMSTLLAGVIAETDEDYGAPYASPSNKDIPVTALCLSDGTEINLTLTQANILNANGVLTALNFMGGFKIWGNYTAAYPDSTDVKEYFIPIRRMFNWVGATLIKTFWARLDGPLTRVLIDSIVDAANIWMNGLTGSGYILGGRVEYAEEDNPTTSLMAGIIKLHVYMTPPSPMQELDFELEYDVSYVEAAFAS